LGRYEEPRVSVRDMQEKSVSRWIGLIAISMGLGIFCNRQLLAQTTPYNDFGRIAAEYVNNCYGIDYLNAKFCEKSAKPEVSSCINSISQLVDPSISGHFQKIIEESLRANQRRVTFERQLDSLLLTARSRSGDEQACQIVIGVLERGKGESFQKAAGAARYLPKITWQR